MKKLEEHYAAEPIAEAVPPTERVLLELLENDERNANLWFALGNVRLRKSRFTEAAESFQKAVECDPACAKARCNLGLALKNAGRRDEALIQLKQAALQDPALALCQFALAKMLAAKGEDSEAAAALEKLLRLEPENFQGSLEMGVVLNRLGRTHEAKQYLERAYRADSSNLTVRNLLGRTLFEEGRQLFEQGELDGAFALWGEAQAAYAPAFVSEQTVAASMRKLIREYNEQGKLAQELASYENLYRSGGRSPELLYRLFSRFYFSVGLMPEAYERLETLEEQRRRWAASLAQRGEHPYPHFRFALIYTYEGKLDEAIAELRLCQDRFPKKKQEALRLNAIIHFASDVKAVQQQKARVKVEGGEDEAWKRAGFENIFELESWRKAGFSPLEASKWKSLGVSSKQAEQWRDAGVPVLEAGPWLEEHFTDPLLVSRWMRKKVEPAAARRWSEESGFSPEEAVAWLRIGFAQPAEAQSWAKVFTIPAQALQWKECGFTPEETAGWLERGVADAFEAKSKKNPKDSDETSE